MFSCTVCFYVSALINPSVFFLFKRVHYVVFLLSPIQNMMSGSHGYQGNTGMLII